MHVLKHRKVLKKKGFTLVELVVVLGIFIVLITISFPTYSNWHVAAQIDSANEDIIQAIRLAKMRSIAGYNNLSHGIFFNNNESGSDSYTLYQGSSYASRDADYDRQISLSETLSSTTTIQNSEINFSKGLGLPSATGTIIIIHSNTNETATITINSLGAVNN